jgi:multidrug efflux pump subunit AcrA (membrane-fusion protein)
VASGIVESTNPGNEERQQQTSGISRARLVQRLQSSTASLPAFINDLIHAQAVVVAGTEAAGFLIERGNGEEAQPAENAFSLRPIAHIRPDSSTPETRAAAIQAFQDLLQPCVEQGKDGAIEVGGAGDTIDPQFCLVTLLRSDGNVVAASAVITRCPSLASAQQRLTNMQLVAGYFELYTLQRTGEQARTIAQSHQHVLQLATAVATASGFQSAAMNLCNELATRTGSSRVSLGWIKGERIRVKSLSHTEEFDKRQELIIELERAMEECFDQEEVVQFEPDGTSSNNVTREHQALSRSQGNNTVISLPLRRQDEIIGVLTLEFPPGQKLGPQAATGLAVAADLLAPQLYDRFQNDRWLITKTGISIRETTKKAIGPKYMLAKLISVAVIALVAFCVFYKPMYRVNAPFSLAANERRFVSAPFDGYIRKVDKFPGDKVKVGDVLFELDTYSLQMELASAMERRNVADRKRMEALNDKEAREGLKPPRVAEAKIAEAEAASADADAKVIQDKINRAVVKATINGVVLDGDLRDKIGAQVRLGDQLMTIGQANNLRGELRVTERDIQDVRKAFNTNGGIGDLAVTSAPTDVVPFKIERIVPTTEVKDGESFYRVFVQFDPASPKWSAKAAHEVGTWFQGMEGQARIEAGHERLAWIYSHRFTDWAKLHLWSNPLFAPFFK